MLTEAAAAAAAPLGRREGFTGDALVAMIGRGRGHGAAAR